ncbi:hypothetical protein D3C80_1812290 [compost metagenome]
MSGFLLSSPVKALPGGQLLADMLAGFEDQLVGNRAAEPVAGFIVSAKQYVR